MVFEWLHAVPRLIADNESSIQAECETLFQELLLDRVTRAGCNNLLNKTSTSSAVGQTLECELESVFPEGVINILKGIFDGEVSLFVKKICTSLGRKKKLKPGIAISLKNIIRASEDLWIKYSRPMEEWTAPSGAWFLLSEVSLFLPDAVDWKFLQHHWKLLDRNVLEKEKHRKGSVERSDEVAFESVSWVSDRVYLLQTISNVAIKLPPDAAADLAQDLLARIEGFNMHFTEVTLPGFSLLHCFNLTVCSGFDSFCLNWKLCMHLPFSFIFFYII